MWIFLQKFKRVTTSTYYQPEVDGLRFVALLMVVGIMHILHYLNDIFYDHTWITGHYWRTFVTDGGIGVVLFFVISGYILSLPFAQQHLRNGRKVKIRRYYLRRLTRLEPPYLVILSILLLLEVYVVKKYALNAALPHFLASVFYVHNFVYQEASTILPLAWSLEVEVQFYIMAPIFCCIYLIRNRLVRRLIMLLVIFWGLSYWYGDWSVPHILKYIHFFVAGMLLTDLYVSNSIRIPLRKTSWVWTLLLIGGLIFFNSQIGFSFYILKMASMFILFAFILFNDSVKSYFSNQWLVVIGGMCYSVYLLHQAIISVVGKIIMYSGINYQNTAYALLFILLFLVSIVIISSIYFLLIEKPFMKWRPGDKMLKVP
jgi:peptidoglycan/LPS O-acetylase OafA/YrhL